MKQTLIEIVQEVLSDISSDEVNSIDDTYEATQVASIVKSCYFNMIAGRTWPHLRTLSVLEHSGSLERPTHMKLPNDIKELVYVEYDGGKKEDGSFTYQTVKYVYPDEFLRATASRSMSQQNVSTVEDPSGVKFQIFTNKAPTIWTSFDDVNLVFDSYNREMDDALQSSRSRMIYYRMPKWRMIDEFVPDLPAEAFPGLVEDAKSYASLNLRQMVNEKAEANAQRQRKSMSRKSWQAHGGVRYITFGRRSRK